MKHLNTYKIFESDDFKEPVDVESDVNDFLEKFAEKFKTWCNKAVSSRNTEYYDKIMSEVNHLLISNPTMTDDWDIYEIHELDDMGRQRGNPMLLVKAVSKLHARIKAANIKNSLELFSTGFYDAFKISKKEHLDKIEKLEKQLQKLKDIK